MFYALLIAAAVSLSVCPDNRGIVFVPPLLLEIAAASLYFYAVLLQYGGCLGV